MEAETQPPVLRAIARLAPFAILSFILQNAYNQLDAWFLGRISPASSNALGLFMFVQIANFGVILVHARGTQSLVGRRIGAGFTQRRERSARRSFHNAGHPASSQVVRTYRPTSPVGNAGVASQNGSAQACERPAK